MFKNLKSLFIVENENDSSSNKEKAEKAQPSGKTKKTTATPNSPKAPTTASAGQITSKFMDVLLKAMEKNNLPGFDYLEFKQSIRSLANVQMDDATRFQSAFAMAQSQGATPAKLIKAAQHYKTILQQEEAKFNQALAGQRAKQVDDKKNGYLNTEKLIKEKEAQIQKLQKEIEQHKASLAKTKNQIQSAAAKVETTKNNFQVTYTSLVSQIDNDIANMQKFLKK